MSLAAGTRLGPYEIVALLGAGGMGEVYRARDTRLRRDIALKILPESFSADADRLARFQREAQLLASLSHPNIGVIHGVEESDGVRALVLELVEGPTLADHIVEGPIPIEEALAIAKQIAEALEAAHEQGIVHRDLKPANIKLRPDGTVKVLDFGLAKAMEPPSGAMSVNVSTSPTITTPAMTQAGIILGTAAYMSPEQAKGRQADKRSDIWAFGCVLYEMLTGRRAFESEDISDTLAFLLTKQPDWSALPSRTPTAIRTLLRRCLEKDRRRRLAHAADARLEIDDAVEALDHAIVESGAVAASRPPFWRRPMAAAIAGLLLGALVAGAAIWQLRSVPSALGITRFRYQLPEGQALVEFGSPILAISPDGTQIVYAADRRFYVRAMSAAEAVPIRGTETPQGQLRAPVFSPDGRSIAFAVRLSSGGIIRRISVAGGTAVSICDGCDAVGPMQWDQSGIVFLSATTSPRRLMRVSADGGRPDVLATLPEDGILSGAQLLPDGDHVLFTVLPGEREFSAVRVTDWDQSQIVVQSLKSGERKVLIEGSRAARFVPTGHLLYARGAVLFAKRFDLKRLEADGAAVPVVEGVRGAVSMAIGGTGTPTTYFDVSTTGSLVYFVGSRAPGQNDLAILDIDRGATPLKLPARPYESPRSSPDGRWVAVGVDDGRDANIWIYDLSGRTAMRQLTSRGRNRFPVWAPDSQRISFQSDREGDVAIWVQTADGSGVAERLTRPDKGMAHIPDSWSPDRKTLLFESDDGSRRTLWTLVVADKSASRFGDAENPMSPLAGMLPFDATFAPSGRWVAYRTPLGASTVVVEPFPATGEKHRIGPGIHPVWSRDGLELSFRQPTTSEIVVMAVTTDSKFAVSRTRQLALNLPGRVSNPSTRMHDIVGTKRFVGVIPAEEAEPARPQIEVVLNWSEELKQRVPTK